MGRKVAIARRLRTGMTLAERKLWRALKEAEFFGKHVRRQAPIGPYIADFACHTSRLVIELDGGQHAEDRGLERDRLRTVWLESQGYRVIRFWNNDVLANVEGVMSVVEAALKAPTPVPSPQGGGGRQPRRPRHTKSASELTALQHDGSPPSPSMGEGWGGGENPASSSSEARKDA